MPSRRLAGAVLMVLSAAAVAQHAWYWPRLPDRVATHFGLDGTPDGWAPRTTAVLTMAAFQVLFPLVLLVLGCGLRRLPDWSINMPHKAYWLAPQRRDVTLAWQGRMLASTAVLTALFVAALSHCSYVANRDGQGLDTRVFGGAVACYLAGVLGLVVRTLRRFRLPVPSA